MADPSGREGLARFKTLLGRLLKVPKEEVLKKEQQYKALRRRQRSRVAPRRKAG